MRRFCEPLDRRSRTEQPQTPVGVAGLTYQTRLRAAFAGRPYRALGQVRRFIEAWSAEFPRTWNRTGTSNV